MVVLPKPANPEKHGSNDDMSDIVWAVVDFLSTVTTTWAQNESVCQRSHSRRDVDRRASCKVETTHTVGPSVRVPVPACDGVVNNRRPDEHEDHARKHATTLGDCTNGNGNPTATSASRRVQNTNNLRDCCKHALVYREQEIRNAITANTWLS